MDIEDTEACYRAVKSRDRRFDGVFYTGVTSTGIYCRPSCPAITPAQTQRHLPPHRRRGPGRRLPGLQALPARRDARARPDWDVAADVAGRAMRLIADGRGRARGRRRARRPGRLHPAAPHRLLAAELGAGPLALARARRAQNARILIETTAMPLRRRRVRLRASPASGSSTTPIREVYAADAHRRCAGPRGRRAVDRPGRIELRLPVRAPYAGERGAALPRRAPGAGRRGERPGLVRAHAARCRTAPAAVRLTLPADDPATAPRSCAAR